MHIKSKTSIFSKALVAVGLAAQLSACRLDLPIHAGTSPTPDPNPETSPPPVASDAPTVPAANCNGYSFLFDSRRHQVPLPVFPGGTVIGGRLTGPVPLTSAPLAGLRHTYPDRSWLFIRTLAGPALTFRVTRFRSDGDLDTGFGDEGSRVQAIDNLGTLYSTTLHCMAPQSDGALVVLGSYRTQMRSNEARAFLARIDRDLQWDASFGDGGTAILPTLQFVPTFQVLTDDRLLVRHGNTLWNLSKEGDRF